MIYYQVEDKFGLSFYDVVRLFPNTSFPIGEDILGFPGVTPYRDSPVPAYDPVRQSVREIAPVDGVQQWEVYSLSDEQIQRNIDNQWNQVRNERNAKLAASDWTQLPDAPVANKEAWAEYRQALRDVTQQTDPFNIVWPVAPV